MPCYLFCVCLKILLFPFDAGAGAGGFVGYAARGFCYPLLPFFKILVLFLRRAQAARAAPYFLLLQKVGKDRRKGVSPPCESPDQSGVLDAPLWKPPSPRWRGKFGANSSPPSAAGASVPLGKAASACALATAAAPPPLRFWGLRPLAPCVPQRGKFAGYAPVLGASPPCPHVPR